MSCILEDHGYGYEVVRNGEEAISLLKNRRPDLVLLDIMMPRKSGIHVFHAMKSEPRLTDVPVVVVTGMSEATGVDLETGAAERVEDAGDQVARRIGRVLREKVLGLEVDGIIEKPVTPWGLISKIDALLGNTHGYGNQLRVPGCEAL
jgi:CheY-like chemotaxis protein